MILVNLFLNMLMSTAGIYFVVSGYQDIKRNWYPKWMCVLEIVGGIYLTIWGFTIWFIE